MPDLMDRVQQHAADLADDALAAHHLGLPAKPGRDMCADPDCGEPISQQRKALGAQLCLACQRAAEARDAHIRTWRSR